ncbi:helix-hairpin-helix domain-containing protein [Murinocardiopsis flavida]|uniref:helix-hairpin-helix domain-containing protein n=1 Tax=Murinocardiopsis flavida TaxID=645275 RepID=UPI000D0D1201
MPADGGPDARLRSVLGALGAPEALAAPLAGALGPGAAEELRDDPWRLLALPQVTREQADYCARRALGADASPDDPRRGRALAARLLRHASREGHTAMEAKRLEEALRSMGVRSPSPALDAAVDGGDAVVFEVLPEGDDDIVGEGGEAAEMPDPDLFYAPPRLGRAEEQLGEALARLTAGGEPVMDSATAAESVQATDERLGLGIAPETTAALVSVALRTVCVLPHTEAGREAVGHVLECVAAMAAESEVGVAVTVPTAQGAAALNAAVPAAAARPLGQLLRDHSPAEPVPAGFVVVAEAMALGAELAAELARACADGTHIVLLADPANAPSAAPGQVVADIVASRTATVAPLPDSPAPGPLAQAAALVSGGELAEVEAPGKEVVTVPAASADEAAHRAVQLLTDSIPRAIGTAADATQIITSARGGEAGADALNTACKERLNPGPGALGGFDPGDRVLLTGRGPGYVPGDTGRLTGAADGGVEVELAGGAVVTVADPAHLRAGWAMTIAAAHGSRWEAVIAVFGPEARSSRPQVHTAITRAERHLSVVQAAGPALHEAVRDVPAIHRQTRLVSVLREA